MKEQEMVGWHYQLHGHEFEQAPGVGDGQESLACCSPWSCRVRHNWVKWAELNCVEIYSLYTRFDVSFYYEWMLNFVGYLLCIFWDNHVIFIFVLLMWYIILIGLWIVNHPCIPGISPTWSRCMILLIYCWIWFTNILLRAFCIYLCQSYWLIILSFCSVFVRFWYHGNGSLNKFESLPSSVFWNSLEGIGTSCFLYMFDRIPPLKLSHPGLLFAGRFLITNSISLLVIHLFRLSVSSWFSLRRLYVSRHLSVSTRLCNFGA